MNEKDRLKKNIIELITTETDADLLDLIYKLLLTEGGNNSLDASLVLCG